MDAKALEIFLDNFDKMAEGLDENGEVNAGIRWKMVLILGGADMEQLAYGWGLKSYNDLTEICPCCLASRDEDDKPFTDQLENANWRPTCPLPNDVVENAKRFERLTPRFKLD